MLHLDPTPTYEEEVAAFEDPRRYQGFDIEAARHRIDRIARWMAILWSFFLAYIIMAQGLASGWVFRWGWFRVYLIPKFHLETSEFVAVVTSTTAAVFAFMVIIAKHLFTGSD